MKHINIPVFIPHIGCPNDCIFCNQRIISGTLKFAEEDVIHIIDNAIATSEGAEREIAFFGGSFTGIDRDLMIRLLDIAENYVKRGDAVGIRMSTRPDYIDPEIVGILKRYTVSQVELGIQSVSDRVLSLSQRGHTSADTFNAVKLLKNSGISVVGQMMIGLPGSSPEDETDTARAICRCGCDGARIYPTIVFKGTKLDEMMKLREYEALSLDEAVERSAAALDIFDRNGVTCLRIGLCDGENLHSDETYAAGPNHPALGELVSNKLFLSKIECEIQKYTELGNSIEGKSVSVLCSPGSTSKVIGNRKRNLEFLIRVYKIFKLKTIENEEYLGYNIKVLFN
ncbi:MAG: radical SAM protein [Clostridia bacterium]|nr:radical SAM protein [Clostridia bacterium]